MLSSGQMYLFCHISWRSFFYTAVLEGRSKPAYIEKGSLPCAISIAIALVYPPNWATLQSPATVWKPVAQVAKNFATFHLAVCRRCFLKMLVCYQFRVAFCKLQCQRTHFSSEFQGFRCPLMIFKGLKHQNFKLQNHAWFKSEYSLKSLGNKIQFWFGIWDNWQHYAKYSTFCTAIVSSLVNVMFRTIFFQWLWAVRLNWLYWMNWCMGERYEITLYK